MIERSVADLADAAGRTIHLSAPDDPRWSGVVVLAPGGVLELAGGVRHDALLLRGTLEDGAGRRLDNGDFASFAAPVRLAAGPSGAALLAYRQAAGAAEIAVPRDLRPWRRGRTPGMMVASLSNEDHALSLLQWQPGARTRRHGHARGEEIFVLRGELCDDGERHPAGSWLRLHPGAWHAPFVEEPTLILVRNGHLRPFTAAA